MVWGSDSVKFMLYYKEQEMDEKIPDFELYQILFLLSDHMILHPQVFASSAQER